MANYCHASCNALSLGLKVLMRNTGKISGAGKLWRNLQ